MVHVQVILIKMARASAEGAFCSALLVGLRIGVRVKVRVSVRVS